MKIVCLCENTAYAPQFRAEHGLSLYIETNGYKLLFDTGQSDLFISNAERLGIRLDEVDFAVIFSWSLRPRRRNPRLYENQFKRENISVTARVRPAL